MSNTASLVDNISLGDILAVLVVLSLVVGGLRVYGFLFKKGKGKGKHGEEEIPKENLPTDGEKDISLDNAVVYVMILEEEWVLFDSNMHGRDSRKFVFWKEAAVNGPVAPLLIISDKAIKDHYDMVKLFEKWADTNDVYFDEITGAGVVVDGRVTDWHTGQFGEVETPVIYWNGIQKVLSAL